MGTIFTMADQLPTGLLELDKILSGEGTLRRGELSIVVGAPPANIKTMFWRQQLEQARKDGKTAAYIDYEMKPKLDLSAMGVKPPDDPITP